MSKFWAADSSSGSESDSDKSSSSGSSSGGEGSAAGICGVGGGFLATIMVVSFSGGSKSVERTPICVIVILVTDVRQGLPARQLVGAEG